MFRKITQSFPRLAFQSRVLPAARFSTSKDGPLKERETAAESVFFNKEDEKNLQKLLNKMSKHVQDEGSKSKSSKQHEKSLEELLKKHNLGKNDALTVDLLKWRRENS